MVEANSYVGDLGYGQYASLVIAGIFSATCSILGSAAIIVMASRKRDRIHQRILVAISAGGVIFSSGNIFHPFLMPKGTPGLRWASGNFASCSAMGFFMSAGPLSVALGNCFLSVYFLLTVRYSWRDRDVTRLLEKAAYATVFLIPMALGVCGVVTESFNPTLFLHICHFNDFPHDCSFKPEVECQRGGELAKHPNRLYRIISRMG